MAKIIWREQKRDLTDAEHLAAEEGEQRREGPGVQMAAKDKAGKDDKLEVKQEGAWYAAELSLREDGITTVHFEGYSEEDEEWNAEIFKSFKPVRDHIRVVSTQLQDEACGLVRLNNIVCALRKGGRKSEGWHDAVVTSIRKRQHKMIENVEICTCSFEVSWLDGPDKGQTRWLGCEDICLLSTIDVETHPLVADILRHANDQGRCKDQEERQKVRRFKRKTSKSTNSAQVMDLSTEHRMRGQIQVQRKNPFSSYADPLHGVRLSSRSGAGPSAKDYVSQHVQHEVRLCRNADGLEADSARGVDLTEDEDCKVQVKKESAISPNAEPSQDSKSQEQKWGNVRSNAESVEEYHLSSEPSSTPRRKVRVYLQSSEKRPGSLTSEVGGLDEEEHSRAKADPMPEMRCKQKRPESVGPIIEERHSKKVRITVDFDIDTRDGKITSYSTNYRQPSDPGGKPWAKAKTTIVEASGPKSEALADPFDNYPPRPKDEKFFQSSVKEEKVRKVESFEGPASRGEELRRPFDNDFEEPKTNPSAKREVADHSRNEELVDSKCQTRLGTAVKDAICLSDEEDHCVIADSTPPPSSKKFSNPNSYGDPLTDQQEGCNVHLDNRARYLRSTFVKNSLTKLGCIMLIDNLELGVRPVDLMEMLLKFCDKERIQSVQIPPPYEQMNWARGFVIFVDKEAADAAEAVLSSGVVVSGRGRPWVVNRTGQEESSSPKLSDFMGDVKTIASGGFKLVTRKQLSEYDAAKQRLKLFEEHRKQTRVMFQRHSQEEKNLDADPDTSLDF